MKNNVYIDEKDPNIPSQSRNLLLNVVNATRANHDS